MMNKEETNGLILEAGKLFHALGDVLEKLSLSMNDVYLNKEKEDEGKVSSKAENKVSLEDVRAVLAKLSQYGKTVEVKALITKYGASRLSEIKESSYAELLKEAEDIKID